MQFCRLHANFPDCFCFFILFVKQNKKQKQSGKFACNVQNLTDSYTFTQSGRLSCHTDKFQAK